MICDCVLYARFSSDQQNPLGCQDQLAECRAFAAKQSWRIVREYQDEAISGAVGELGRAGWASLLADVRRGLLPPGGRVVIWSISRWSRDYRDGIIAALELDRHGIALADCTGRVYDQSDFAGIINLTVEQHHAAAFLAELRRNIRRGLAKKRERGFWTCPAPYGYQIRRDHERRQSILIPHPTQAEVVRRIFSALAGGITPTRIARNLSREGVPAARGGAWHPATIRNLVCNPTYLGVVPHYPGGERGASRFASRQARLEPGQHEALVDEQLWRAARGRLPGPGPSRRKSPPRKRPLSGVLRCGECGAAMIVTGGTMPYRYYRCRPYGVETGCPSERLVRIVDVEEAVAGWVRRLWRRPKDLRAVAKIIQRQEAAARASADAALEPRRRQLQDLVARQGRLLAALESGIEPAPAVIVERLRDLDAEVAELERQMEAGAPPGDPLPLEAIESALEDLVRDGGEPTRWRDLIDRIEVPADSGLPLTVHALGGVHQLAIERAARPSWWAPRGAARRS